MLIKIDRSDCLRNYPKFPRSDYNYKKDEEIIFYPKTFKSYVLILEHKSTKGLTNGLGIHLSRLIKNMEFQKLIFLGDNSNFWISKLSSQMIDDSKPLKNAIEYLLKNNIGKRFNGGLEVNILELPVFFKHFYSLIRCDASLPYFHFMDEKQNILGSIHYTGEVTIDVLKKGIDKLLNDNINKTEFLIKQ